MNLLTEHIRVKLELFEGPLDLLLHLINTQHIDIASIPIAQITNQYLETIELMKELDLNVAGEYLVMAATLILIKSRLLLPPARNPEEESAEEMKEKLIQRLKKYELFKKAGNHLEKLEEDRKKYLSRPDSKENTKTVTNWVIEASVIDLFNAFKDVIERNKDRPVHLIKPNPVSIRKKMSEVIQKLNTSGMLLFTDLFADCRYRRDIIGIFLAILELVRLGAIRAGQRSVFSEIRLTAIDGASGKLIQ